MSAAVCTQQPKRRGHTPWEKRKLTKLRRNTGGARGEERRLSALGLRLLHSQAVCLPACLLAGWLAGWLCCVYFSRLRGCFRVVLMLFVWLVVVCVCACFYHVV